MRPRLLLLSLLFVSTTAVAQFATVPVDARSAAMGGCTLFEEGRYAALSYRQGFGVAGMATKRIAAGWTFRKAGTVEAGYSHFGDLDYSEQQLSAGYRMRIAEGFEAGVAGSYLRQGVSDAHYEVRRWMAVAVMARLQLGRSLQLAATAGSRPWDHGRPLRWQVAMDYRAVEDVQTLVAVEDDEGLRLRCGMEYGYRSLLFFRAGMASRPFSLTFGLGVHYRSYRLDLSVESHRVLGLTPQISMALWF